MDEITIPGTNTKIPVVGALAAALVIAIIVILRRGGEESEQAGDVSGLLAAELDQRLREQWEATVNLIAEAMEEIGQSDPTSPPATPVDPSPKTPFKQKQPVHVVELREVIVGGPVKVIRDEPVTILPSRPVVSAALQEVTVGGPVKAIRDEPLTILPSRPVVSAALPAAPDNVLYGGQPDGSPITDFGNRLAKPATHKGGASLYTLGSYDLL